MARLQCTHREAAAFLGIRVHQFRSLLASDDRVKQAWERGLMMGRISLRRKQFRLAGANSSMSIFLGKQILGQRDVSTTEHTGADGGPIDFDASDLSQDERDELRTLLTRSSKPRDGAEGT
ncbi:MAG: hypothetical protein ACTSUU_06870 [Candidatus Thorarchaeota archaeon]